MDGLRRVSVVFPGFTACAPDEDATALLLLFQKLQNLAMKLNIFAAILCLFHRRKNRKAFGTTIVTTGPPSSLSVEQSVPAL